TGVGKTLLTGLLLAHLRRTGTQALAMKPFSCGSRADAEFLHNIQNEDLTLDEINPFHFPEPVAPLLAARKHHRRIPLQTVLRHVQSVLDRHLGSVSPPLHHSITPSLHHSTISFLLIEGAGGLLAPLGERYSAIDLIEALNCS